jgi:hypothetical protein
MGPHPANIQPHKLLVVKISQVQKKGLTARTPFPEAISVPIAVTKPSIAALPTQTLTLEFCPPLSVASQRGPLETIVFTALLCTFKLAAIN